MSSKEFHIHATNRELNGVIHLGITQNFVSDTFNYAQVRKLMEMLVGYYRIFHRLHRLLQLFRC